MDISQRIRNASVRILDALTVFRFASRQAEDQFHEAAYLWPDARGREFSRGRLAPQVDAMATGSEQLNRLHHEAGLASVAAAIGEDAWLQAVAALGDCDEALERAGRHIVRAADATSIASASARDALHQARQVRSGLDTLGSPPV